MRRRRRTVGALLTALTVMIAGSACGSSVPEAPATLGPTEPYEHRPMNETSVAQPVATGGDVDRVAAGLEGAGFFCAQVRANDAARQIWCRRAVPGPGPRGDVEVTTVDLVTTQHGDLQYAGIDLPARSPASAPGGRPYADRLRAVLDASLLALWPEDADEVQAAVADLGHPYPGWDAGDPRDAESRTTTTGNASYRVTEIPDAGFGSVDRNAELSLTATTPLMQDSSWPYGSEHYATTTTLATPGLVAGGYECQGPVGPCNRPAVNAEVRFGTFTDTERILTVDFGVYGDYLDQSTALVPLTAKGFAQGLTFLDEEVRAPVEQAIDHARTTGESSAGIVAGVVLILDAGNQSTSEGTFAAPVRVTVGVPLVDPRPR